MIKKLLMLALLAANLLLTANATPVLAFNPSSQSLTLGSQATVEIVLSGLENGLDEILSAYDITVLFDSSVIDLASIGALDFGNLANIDSSIAGQISWNSTATDADSVLQTSQGDSISLGTLTFSTIGLGNSGLSFDFHDLTGLNATALEHNINTGSIIVTSPSTGTIPEPSTFVLMSLVAMGFAMVKQTLKKHQHSPA
jgi:hypothetical protein